MMDSEDEERQRVFYSQIRESIISLLLLVVLYLGSYWLVARYKRHRTREDCYSGEEDAAVYRITTWLCSFALCVSIGSALLLPMSIISNEILVHYPKSYYVRWLNTSLIQGLWNEVFLGCNLCLFILLPFAYFFTESAGFSGSRKGLMSRVYETILLLSMLGVMATVLAGLLSSIFSRENTEAHWWQLSYLPLIYSVVSMLGVLLMSVCTPLGFSSLFTLLGAIITRPMLHGNVEEDLERLKLEEAAMQRRKKLQDGRGSLGVVNGGRLSADGDHFTLDQLQRMRKKLERQIRSSPWERNFVFPLCFLVLLGMTVMALFIVTTNTLKLLYHQASVISVQDYLLGYESTSDLGVIGAMLEVALIVYFMCASVVGLYSTPSLQWLLPVLHDTSMTKIIANCIILLVLSSALPLMARTLGITRFNLLGHFGSFEWLSNFWVVLGYNALFFLITTLILSQRVIRTLAREASLLLRDRLKTLRTKWIKTPQKSEHTD